MKPVVRRRSHINIIIMSIIAISSIFIITGNLWSTRFFYEDSVGDVYELNSFVNQSVFIDEKLDGEYEYKYVGNLEVVDKMGTSSKLEGTYYAYNKPTNSSEPYKLINEETTKTEFIRRKNGKMVIDKSYLYPTVRDLPTFPQRDIKVGEKWEAEALEVMDLSSLGVKEPYRIPLSVSYEYLRDEIFKEKEVAVFSIKYYFEYDLFEKPDPNSESVKPIFLTGLFEGEYYWDKKNSTPLFYEAKAVFVYLLKNSQVLEVRSTEYGEVKKKSSHIAEEEIDDVDERRKKEIAENIKEDLIEKELDDDFKVKEKDNGVAINLSDILFDFDSAELRPSEMEKLDKIVRILKRYENFDLIVEGHSDNIGSAEFNQQLSEERAESVKNYLELKGIDSESLTAIGYGERRPVASNETEEGRALNRRVEIIIITDKYKD